MKEKGIKVRQCLGHCLCQYKNRIRMLLLAGVMFFVIGCNKEDMDPPPSGVKESTPSAGTAEKKVSRESVVLTVGDMQTTYEELMLYMWSRKQETEDLYGEEIWGYVLDDIGTTYGDKLKEQVLAEIEYIKIVAAQGAKLSISLSEDEKMDVDEYTADFLSGFTEDAMRYYDFKEESVRKIYEENVLANKIYERLTLNVDTDVSDEEARHVRLYYILMAKYTYDADGKRIDFTEDELLELEALVEEVYGKTAEEDFYMLAREYSSDEDEIEIVAGRGDMGQEFEELVFGLISGEVTPVIENEIGYYIFYCKSEIDEEATAAAKEKIIIDRQNAAFNESYLSWEKDTEVVLDEKLWEQIGFDKE